MDIECWVTIRKEVISTTKVINTINTAVSSMISQLKRQGLRVDIQAIVKNVTKRETRDSGRIDAETRVKIKVRIIEVRI